LFTIQLSPLTYIAASIRAITTSSCHFPRRHKHKHHYQMPLDIDGGAPCAQEGGDEGDAIRGWH